MSCISKESILRLQENGHPIVFIDVRSDEEFKIQHIEGSVHIPVNDIINFTKEMDKSLFYITICSMGGGRSDIAAAKLQTMGFVAQSLCGGVQNWDSESSSINAE